MGGGGLWNDHEWLRGGGFPKWPHGQVDWNVLHAVWNKRNAVKIGLVPICQFCTVVSYFWWYNWASRFLKLLTTNTISENSLS